MGRQGHSGLCCGRTLAWRQFGAREVQDVIDALIARRLIGKPTARLARSGSEHATPWLRVVGVDGGAVLVSAIAFAAPTWRGQLAPGGCDSVGVAGAASPRAYVRGRKPTPDFDITVQLAPTAHDLAPRLASNMNGRTGDGAEQDEA